MSDKISIVATKREGCICTNCGARLGSTGFCPQCIQEKLTLFVEAVGELETQLAAEQKRTTGLRRALNRAKRVCGVCDGKGRVSSILSDGSELAVPCSRCQEIDLALDRYKKPKEEKPCSRS